MIIGVWIIARIRGRRGLDYGRKIIISVMSWWRRGGEMKKYEE